MTAALAKQDRRAWLEQRRHAVGASEVSSVLGLNPWKSKYCLWAEKCGLASVDNADETEAQQWGLLLEEPIAEAYRRQTGRELINHGQYAIKHADGFPILSATLDREIVPIDERGPGVLEIKTAAFVKDNDWSDGAPLLYQIQIQAQLAVTNFQWGSAAVLIGGQKFRWCDVERDEAFIDMMRRKVAEFWRMVDTKTPPPVDGSQSTAEVLRRLYPNDSGATIALGGEAINWRNEMIEADEIIKAATERKNEAKNKIIAVLADNTFGVLPDGERFSYKTTTRKESVVKASSYRTLRRHAK